MPEPRAMLDLRQVDELVAIHVFGWVRRTAESNSEQLVTVPPDWTDFTSRRWLGRRLDELVPSYTTSWESAGQVVERMRALEWQALFTDTAEQRWYAIFDNGAPATSKKYRQGEAVEATFPLAVSLAALAALGVEIPQ